MGTIQFQLNCLKCFIMWKCTHFFIGEIEKLLIGLINKQRFFRLELLNRVSFFHTQIE